MLAAAAVEGLAGREGHELATTGPEPVVVDVREDLRHGRQPLTRILAAVKALAAGQNLTLLTTFEPVPLYKLLGARGFDHEARALPGGEWEIRFTRRPRPRSKRAAEPTSAPAAPPSTGVAPSGAEARWTRLDNRGLEPPEPMMRTFAALGGLAPGEVLEIHNDRRPMFLYPHLEERGYGYETVDEADGSAFVRIWQIRR